MATQLVAQTPDAERFSLMQREAALFASSPLIPAHLRAGGERQAMANCYLALKMAQTMGEDPMVVMQNIVIVHGTAGFKAQYMIARANASGVFKDCIDWEIEGAGQNLKVTAFATLKGTDRRVSVAVDMAMAKAEGWTKNSKYSTMPEVMLRYRSATFLVRFYAPQVMLGIHSADEMEDVGFAASPVDLAAQPITAAALLEQARTEGPEDGEIVQEGPADTDRGEANTITAAELIDRINARTTAIDINSLVGSWSDAIGEMSEEDRAAVAEAQQARIAALRG